MQYLSSALSFSTVKGAAFDLRKLIKESMKMYLCMRKYCRKVELVRLQVHCVNKAEDFSRQLSESLEQTFNAGSSLRSPRLNMSERPSGKYLKTTLLDLQHRNRPTKS